MSAPAAGPRRDLPRTLSTLDVATLLVAVTIGAGIYATPTLIARHLSSLPAVLGCWLAGGAFAWLAAAVYAEVGSRLPEAGGEYIYLRRVFGPRAGFVLGWIDFFLVAPSARLGLAMVAAVYLLPASAGGQARVGVTVLLIVALCALNYVGVRSTLAAQRLFVTLKLAGLAALIVVAWATAPAPSVPPPLGPAAGGRVADVAASMLLVSFSYLGFAQVAALGGEMRRPGRALPRGLAMGVGLVTTLYLGTILSYYRVLGADGVARADSVAAETGAVLFGPLGRALIAGLVVVSAVSSMTVGIQSHARVYYAMARDRLFLPSLDYVHPRFATPSRAIVAHGVACLVLLALRQSLELTLVAMAFGRLLFMGMVGLALFRLRRAAAAEATREIFRVPFHPVLPALFLAGVVVLAGARVALQPRETLLDAAVLVAALPLLPIARWLGRRLGRRAAGGVVG